MRQSMTNVKTSLHTFAKKEALMYGPRSTPYKGQQVATELTIQEMASMDTRSNQTVRRALGRRGNPLKDLTTKGTNRKHSQQGLLLTRQPRYDRQTRDGTQPTESEPW